MAVISQTFRSRWKMTLAFIVGGGFLAVLLVIGGAAGLAWTSTEAFCIGCHEMKNNVYAEYQGTVHDTNRSGVRAICPDCHVPHEVGPLLVRKMRASFELWGHLTGKIDTKEKFQARRYELATHVWTRMKKTDSLECRNCHKFEKMDLAKQKEKARDRHLKAQREHMTCIDCHFAIAHQEPEGPGPQEIKVD